MSENENLWSSLVETMVLHSKLLFVEGRFDEAKEKIEQAKDVAEINEMLQYQKFVSKVKNDQIAQFIKMRDLVKRNHSFSERIDEIDILDYINSTKDIINSGLTEDPILFLILDVGGSIRYSKTFNSSISTNEALLGSFLAAINQFGYEALKGSIDRINQKEYTITLKEVDSNLLCYIYRGYSSQDIEKIGKIVKRLKTTDVLTRISNNLGIRLEDDELELGNIIESIILT
jgi:hypothetical protein